MNLYLCVIKLSTSHVVLIRHHLLALTSPPAKLRTTRGKTRQLTMKSIQPTPQGNNDLVDTALSLLRLNSNGGDASSPRHVNMEIGQPTNIAWPNHIAAQSVVVASAARQHVADKQNITPLNMRHQYNVNHNLNNDVTSVVTPQAAPVDEPKSKRKYTKKTRDPKRDTTVSFDEMKRLMRVYGPVKCLRNRTPKDSGRNAKPESIRRKFYRWFPDFDERFQKTLDGWYKPKFGHEAEMAHREDMRKRDHDLLVRKRNSTRYCLEMIDDSQEKKLN